MSGHREDPFELRPKIMLHRHGTLWPTKPFKRELCLFSRTAQASSTNLLVVPQTSLGLSYLWHLQYPLHGDHFLPGFTPTCSLSLNLRSDVTSCRKPSLTLWVGVRCPFPVLPWHPPSHSSKHSQQLLCNLIPAPLPGWWAVTTTTFSM